MKTDGDYVVFFGCLIDFLDTPPEKTICSENGKGSVLLAKSKNLKEKMVLSLQGVFVLNNVVALQREDVFRFIRLTLTMSLLEEEQFWISFNHFLKSKYRFLWFQRE